VDHSDAPKVFEGDPSVAWLLGSEGFPAHIDPTADAVCSDHGVITYADLKDRSLRLAAALRQSGLNRGDRVATFLFNRAETFDIYFASAYAGVTLVPVNFRFSVSELAEVLVDCDAKWLFSEEQLSDRARQAAELAGTPLVTVLADDRSGPEYEALVTNGPLAGPYVPADPHLILFSSGTTGKPKGAMLSHRSIISYALQQAAVYPHYGSEMTLLITGPLFNTGGINDLTIATFAVGGRVAILASRNWTAERMADSIRKWEATHTIVFPSMMEPMLASDPAGERCKTLRLVVTGGETCPAGTVKRFKDRWQHAVLAIGYGSTELGLATVIMGSEIDSHPGSVGRVASGSAVRISGSAAAAEQVGAVGEIYMAGPSAFSGYLNAPELTAQTIRDGWIASGDLGHIDAEGHLYLDGRMKDMIISGGQNIYPAEIENAMSDVDGLVEYAVIGVPDTQWGEAVCAVVVVVPGMTVTAEDVTDHISGKIGSYKKPKHVVFVDRLERSEAGKVVKRLVKKQVQVSGYEGPGLSWDVDSEQ